MEVENSVDHRARGKIIDIATPKISKKRKRISASGAKTKQIVSSSCLKPSSSGTKKVFINIDDYDDDDIQILDSNSMSTVVYDRDNNFTCDICVDEKPMSDKFKIMGCKHTYCKQCIAKYVASKLQENISRISCPVSGCNGLLEPYWCRSILPKEVFDRWGDALCEGMLLKFQKFYCPFKDCSAVLIDEDGGNLAMTETKCLECRRLFCAKCKVPWHKGIVCEEFQKLKDESGKEDIQLKKLANRRKWQRCPKCGFYVERNQGCPNMVCRCGCNFCYICGASFTNHNPLTCGKRR